MLDKTLPRNNFAPFDAELGEPLVHLVDFRAPGHRTGTRALFLAAQSRAPGGFKAQPSHADLSGKKSAVRDVSIN